MRLALDQARAAAARGEVPVGAVIIRDGAVLAQAGNETLARDDPTAHAEMLVIRAATAASGSQRLAGANLYVTLEPCPMCAAAISFARIRRLYYGADDQKGGAVENGVRLFRPANLPPCARSLRRHRRKRSGGAIAWFFQRSPKSSVSAVAVAAGSSGFGFCHGQWNFLTDLNSVGAPGSGAR